MRFLLVDRITEFVPHISLRATFAPPRSLVYPVGRPESCGPSPALLLEMMAQSGGWLVKASSDFKVLAIMSVVEKFCCVNFDWIFGRANIDVQIVHTSQKLVTVKAALRADSGETIASVEAISYVLIAVDQKGYEWGQAGWAVLTGGRDISAVRGRI